MQSVGCGLILAPGTDSSGKEALSVSDGESGRLTRSVLTLTDDSTGDFQGNHCGPYLYLTLSIRKLSGYTKLITHLDQQTTNTLVDFEKRGEVFCSTGVFILKHTLSLKDKNSVSDKKCLCRSQLPKHQGIHDMKKSISKLPACDLSGDTQS